MMELAPPKRPRLAANELRGVPNDPAEVQACFAIQRWNSKQWLNGLGGDGLKEHKEFLESERNYDRQVLGTLERVPAFKNLKAIADNWEHRTQAVRQYLSDIVVSELSRYNKAEWLGVVRAAHRELDEI